jgi:hypothetical protein
VRERMDRDYVTEVELVSQSADYDSLRRAWNANPYSAAIRQQRLGKTWADNVEGNQFSLLPNSSFPTYTSSGVISSGTTFPSSPAPNQIFLLTADSGSYIAGYYYYDTGLGDWVIQSVNFGYGASFPVSPTEGQLFYHTGWGYMFRYSLAGTEWVALDYDLDAVTGLTVDNDPTGLNNDSAATGLANNATGNHSHDTSYISGYVVENYTLLYAASVSGGSPTTSFYAPTTISGSEYCVVGTGVISGGGHNHTHGTDSHDTSHGTDSHDHSTNESNHIHDVIKTGDPP